MRGPISYVDNRLRAEEEGLAVYEHMLEEKRRYWPMGVGLLSWLRDLVNLAALSSFWIETDSGILFVV